MKNNLKLVIILAIIAGLSGLSLTLVNNITQPIIIKAKEEHEMEIIQGFYPNTDHTTTNEIDTDIDNQILVYDNQDNLLGYVYSASGSNGYGAITTLVAINLDNQIIGIDFSEFSQTPGFGDKLLTEEYLGQYTNLDVNDPTVDGVSGATFSSKLVADEVNTITNYHLENGGLNE